MLNATPQLELWPEEEWRAVPGYEGLYQVSSWGRVWSMPRATTRGGIMKQTMGHGRLVVTLTCNGVQRTRLVHQLVAEAFLEEQPEGTEVCHEDGDPTNNHVENLRYDTHAGNMQDMLRHGRGNQQNKTHCPKKHKYDEANTVIYEGRRFCRECARIKSLEYYNATKPPKRQVTGVCPVCDAPFDKTHPHHRRKYCSDECKEEASRKGL